MSTPDNRSYLAASIDAISPWGSRSSTPVSGPTTGVAAQGEDSGLGKQQGGDHTISHRHRLNLKSYPRDCPSVNVKWFYAVDVPKRKPLPINQPLKDAKPVPQPKKYVAFSAHDSRSIESAFQKLEDEEDEPGRTQQEDEEGDLGSGGGSASRAGLKQNTSINDSSDVEKGGKIKVPVNEDFLFDVDIETRELAPVYWLGPIYEVRRGTWFYQEGSTLRPCDENLATQLEEGYLKLKPWRHAIPSSQRSSSQSRSRPTSLKAGEDLSTIAAGSATGSAERKISLDAIRGEDRVANTETPRHLKDSLSTQQAHLQTHRLFGTYMNSIVTYQDGTTAWILTDDFLSRMSSTVYQRFAGGGHLGGIKVVRGFSEAGKSKEAKEGKDTKFDGDKGSQTPTSTVNTEGLKPVGNLKAEKAYRRRSAPPPGITPSDQPESPLRSPESETRRQALERDMSSFVALAEPEDPEKQEEEVRQRDEKEIQEDYRDEDSEEQDREIEHIILVTHGIGQRLGLRMESVNFVHDVNVLRKTLKDVYASSADLQALNSEVDKLPKNCRVQVLPVCWRHLLDFPKQSLKQNRKEYDLGDADDFGEEEKYPSLEDITIEGVPAVRSLITDLALDILLYQSAYRDHIAGIVQRECNRIFKLFLQRNPYFNGKVSLIGHSLGSAIMFDILCRQKDAPLTLRKPYGHQRSRAGTSEEDRTTFKLDFDVDNFFCLGSPIGLFQMLKGRTIAGRAPPGADPTMDPLKADSMDDPFLAGPASKRNVGNASNASGLPITISSPKCDQLYNIFHPTDPISYRIEPLISSAMASLKPQPLPYTKKGIFGAPGLTNIGARVGQSVSGLWTSLSSGIASSLLNRSLGITGEEGRLLASSATQNTPGDTQSALPARILPSLGAGTNISGGGVIPSDPASSPNAEVISDDKKRKLAQDTISAEQAGEHPPTLIDSEIETLYAGFQKRRKSHQSDEARDLGESPEWLEAEERGRRLRREEEKVRALNSNGRVDYSIQEGVFDISLIASIASHLSYWGDEDVSHFMISQMLSRHRVVQRRSM